MVGLKGFDISKIPIIFILGYAAFWIVAFLLQQFGLIESGQNLGFGFAILAAALGMVLVYKIIVKEGLNLSFNSFLTIFILAGVLIGILAFLPGIVVPSPFQASISQFSTLIMSIAGG